MHDCLAGERGFVRASALQKMVYAPSHDMRVDGTPHWNHAGQKQSRVSPGWVDETLRCCSTLLSWFPGLVLCPRGCCFWSHLELLPSMWLALAPTGLPLGQLKTEITATRWTPSEGQVWCKACHMLCNSTLGATLWSDSVMTTHSQTHRPRHEEAK